ncbi:class I SAM-dependent methyltransferase [Burkholderia latens]|uniref:class I SAM-dependent methyltransferase n=1 Tax=Burkholderia latens TaxID=488446 RepID=UPI001FC8C93D|nr:class I SAM-dependent methyltransferase [Burkholderia latens]
MSEYPHARPMEQGVEDWRQTAMIRLAGHFNSLATGTTQVPSRSIESPIRGQIADQEVVDYHDAMVAAAGPLFRHFLGSVPHVLEELARVGVALHRVAHQPGQARRFSLLEVDAFDGTCARTLARRSGGRIRTLTTSPNVANEPHFVRDADPASSRFFPESIFALDETKLAACDIAKFGDGFDWTYEMAAFQFYTRNRAAQIAHVKRFMKPDGLAFFLEKLNQPDADEYERREQVKDQLFKSRYFTQEEIAWKRQQMLEQMENGQVTFDVFISALREHFEYVYLLWNSTNFYEFVASNDRGHVDRFLMALGPINQPDVFCFEASRIGQRI